MALAPWDAFCTDPTRHILYYVPGVCSGKHPCLLWWHKLPLDEAPTALTSGPVITCQQLQLRNSTGKVHHPKLTAMQIYPSNLWARRPMSSSLKPRTTVCFWRADGLN